MSSPNTVASVLLLATHARQRLVVPWLRVVGEPVGYALETLEPDEVPGHGRSWDVIVVDGESISSYEQRGRVLRRVGHYPHSLATTIYLASRSCSERESAQALAWVDDLVSRGAEMGDRVHRRIQSVALAPWRRTTALRFEADRLGPRRLRLVQSEPSAPPAAAFDEPPVTRRSLRRLDRALPFILLQRAAGLGAQTHRLVTDAFHEGRRVGVATAQENMEQICAALAREIERGRRQLRPEDVADIEEPFRVEEGSAIVAARFGGAAAVLEAVGAEVKRQAEQELAAIDRHAARPASEP